MDFYLIFIYCDSFFGLFFHVHLTVVAIVKDDVDQTTDEIDVENAVTEVGMIRNIKLNTKFCYSYVTLLK